MEHPKTRRENEIWQACDDLWAQHAATSKITGDAIREQLLTLGYKKGSPNEIYKFRRTWKLSRGVSDEAPDANDTVQNDPISRAVSLVYEQIHANAQSELDAVRGDFETRLVDLQTQLESLQSRYDELDERSGDQQRELEHAKQVNLTLTKSLASSEQQHALLQERHQNSERLHAQHKLDQVELLAELKKVQEREIDLWRAQISEVKAQLKAQGQAFSDEVTALRVTIRDTTEQKSEATKTAALLQQRLEKTKLELQITSQELRQQRSDNKQLSAKTQRLELKCAQNQRDIALLTKQKSEFRSLLAKLKPNPSSEACRSSSN
jgi:chromosome segregation ATPase